MTFIQGEGGASVYFLSLYFQMPEEICRTSGAVYNFDGGDHFTFFSDEKNVK